MTATLAQQSSTRGLEAEFLDLICADEELLRAEFDAIIAVGWPTEPPTVRETGRRREHRPAGGRGARRSALGSGAGNRTRPAFGRCRGSPCRDA